MKKGDVRAKHRNPFVKFLCLALIFLLNINVFAVTTGDNDGSAFITKAEFDSLKNNFQSQIDTYNQSIDSKIDAAITAYLSGVRIFEEAIEYWDTITSTLGTKLKWKNNWGNTPGSATITPNYNISVSRTANLKSDWGVHFYYLLNINPGWGQKVWNSAAYGSESDGSGYCVYVGAVGGTNADLNIAGSSTQRAIQWRGGRNRQTGFSQSEQQSFKPSQMVETTSTSWATYASVRNAFSYTNNTSFSANKTEVVVGSGTAYLYHKQPDSSLELREYATTLYPNYACQVYYHNYQNFTVTSNATFTQFHCTDHGRDFTTATATLTPTLPTSWGTKTEGTKPAVTSTTDGANQKISTLTLMKTTDGVEYNTFQYGGDVSKSIYCMDELANFTVKSTTKNIELKDMTWNDIYFQSDGGHLQTNKYNDIIVKVKEIGYPTVSKKANNFTIQSLSAIAGEPVKIGGGVPLCKFMDDNVRYKLTLQFESTSTATSGNKVNYKISDKQFNLGNLATGAKNIASGSVNINTDVNIEIDTEKDEMIWITLDSVLSNVDATIKSITLTKI